MTATMQDAELDGEQEGKLGGGEDYLINQTLLEPTVSGQSHWPVCLSRINLGDSILPSR
jgi:hypothetical protein